MSNALLCLLTTLITSLCWLAGSAVARWRRDLRSTRARKPPPSAEPNPNSVESRLAQVEADQASLFSTLGKLTTTVKRVSSRAGMQELRGEGRGDRPPPPGSPKHVVREYYRARGIVAGPREVQQRLGLVSNDE